MGASLSSMISSLNEKLKETASVDEVDDVDDFEEEIDFDKSQIRHIDQIDIDASSVVIEEADIPYDTYLFFFYVYNKLYDILEESTFDDFLDPSEHVIIDEWIGVSFYELEDEDGNPIYEEIGYGDRVRSISRDEVVLHISPNSVETIFWKMILYLEILHDNNVYEKTEDDNEKEIYPGLIADYLSDEIISSDQIEESKKRLRERAQELEQNYEDVMVGVFEQKEIIPDHESPSSMKNKCWRTIRFCFEANRELKLGLKIGMKINNQLDKWKEAGFNMTPRKGVWEHR